VLTDPILRDRISFLRRTSSKVDPAAYKDIDLILISHLHYDHLDFASLEMVTGKYQIITPSGTEQVLRKQGIDGFQEIMIGDKIQIGNLEIKAVHADHTRSRHPLGPSADAIGFIISSSAKIYYPGDTRLFPEMGDFVQENLDLVLMPVWGWGFNRGRMHMGPKEAAEALNMIRPKVAIPIHWGTFVPMGLGWMKPAFNYFPPLDFVAHAKKIAPQVQTRILQPGEAFHLSG